MGKASRFARWRKSLPQRRNHCLSTSRRSLYQRHGKPTQLGCSLTCMSKGTRFRPMPVICMLQAIIKKLSTRSQCLHVATGWISEGSSCSVRVLGFKNCCFLKTSEACMARKVVFDVCEAWLGFPRRFRKPDAPTQPYAVPWSLVGNDGSSTTHIGMWLLDRWFGNPARNRGETARGLLSFFHRVFSLLTCSTLAVWRYAPHKLS